MLEYIAYLIKDKNICHCFIFSYYYNYKSYEINDFNAKIIDYKDILDNLYLSKISKKFICNCGDANSQYLKCSKKRIFEYYNQSINNNENKIKNLENQKKDDDIKFKKLKEENININKQISNLKRENIEQKNNINILEENRKVMDKKNKLLEITVNGDQDKILFLNEHGIFSNNLTQKENIIKIDPETNQYIGNEKKIEKKFIDFYDVIIHINSIKDLNKG